MATNDFLPFCATDTGTNLETQADYLVDSDRTQGNQPGVAKSKLVNKALRQSSYVSGLLAQLCCNTTGADAVDNATPTQFLALLQATLSAYPVNVTKFTSGSGNFNLTYLFFIVSGSATVGATYTNNGVTYTVKATVASATLVSMSGNGDPLASGTLTKASGTGDSSLVFYAYRKPIYLRVQMVGGGGGGQDSNLDATAGGNTTFGSTFLVANGGTVSFSTAFQGPVGGSASIGAGATGIALTGGYGCNGSYFSQNSTPQAFVGASGGSSFFGGAGSGGDNNSSVNAKAGVANTGGGGGGGGGFTTGVNHFQYYPGGGAGGYVDAIVPSPASTYPYAVGAGGSGGTNSQSNPTGAAGGSGLILVEEHYQ